MVGVLTHLPNREECIKDGFSAPTGTPVYAPDDGSNRVDSRSAGYGKHIRIDHGFGYVTLSRI